MRKRNQFDAEEAKERLEAEGLWEEIVHLKQVGSTNEVAKTLASRGAPAGTVVVADEQTAGRGRLGRRWNAPPDTSLLCSILFRPDLGPGQAHQLTMLCSMAAADAIMELAELAVGLKWPNDLVVRSQIRDRASPAWRKLAGILTESSVSKSHLDYVVVGIGINVNVRRDQLASLAPNATSILAETGTAVNRWQLLVAVLRAVAARYQRLEDGQSPRREWSARLTTLGRHVEVTTSDGVLVGVAEAVDEDGALLLRTDEGSLRRLLAGDVTLADSEPA